MRGDLANLVQDSAVDFLQDSAVDSAKYKRQILREFGYKLTRYSICSENTRNALDSANKAIKNNRRVNRVILFLNVADSADCAVDSANGKKSAESSVDSAKSAVDSAKTLKAILRNLTQNGVEIVVFLKDFAEAKKAINFWRAFGIVYLVKDSQNLL